MAVPPAIKALLDRLIPTGEAEIAPQPVAAPQPKVPPLPAAVPPRVSIDHEKVARLAAESDELMARLLQDVEAASHVPVPAIRPSPQPQREGIQRPAGTPDGLLTDLDPVSDILKGLAPKERTVLQILATGGWEAEDGALADALDGMLLEPPIDRINGLSLEFLGDLLIASEGGRRVVAEDYRDELEHLLPKSEAAVLAPGAQTGLAAEWADFRRELAEYQLKALGIVAGHDDPGPALQELAAGQGLMPEMLIDSINELALGMVGDLVVMPDTVPLAICEESLRPVQYMLRSSAT